MSKKFYFIIGFISLVLGCVGIFLPILPTTPFLLLSCFLFEKSSPKFHYFILNNKYFGKYIKDYREKKGITLKNKIYALATLWIGISFSLYRISSLHLQIFLGLVLIGVTFHILKINTLK